MTKKMIDADALIKEMQSIKGNLNFCNDAGSYWLDIAIETINELATPAPEPQENCKSNLKKFSMQLFEAFGQNVEAGKIAIDDDDFDKMETIAFRLIDAMKIATPAEPQESIFDADGWCDDLSLAPKNGSRILGLTSFGVETVKYCDEKNIDYTSIAVGWIGCERDTTCLPEVHCAYSGIRNCQNQPMKWRPLPTLPKDKS